jgi:hypothetical protein
VAHIVHLEHAGRPLSHFFFVRVHFSQALLARVLLGGVEDDLSLPLAGGDSIPCPDCMLAHLGGFFLVIGMQL